MSTGLILLPFQTILSTKLFALRHRALIRIKVGASQTVRMLIWRNEDCRLVPRLLVHAMGGRRSKATGANKMAFKTLLTVTGPELGDRDLRVAADLCSEINAHLSVLVVALAAPPPVGEYAAMVSDVWLTERREGLKNLQERTTAVSKFLGQSALSSDLSSEYQESAWADDAIGRRARYADLTVVGPEMLARETLKDKVVEGSLFLSGKPLLLVPEGSRPTLKPKRVMIAWDSRLEASRAVREALEILARAEEVRIVLVDPAEGESGQGSEPGADVATYLARHGAKVTVDRLPSQGKTVAAMLRQHAVDTAAELLVIGAYGHSRLRERIFGGVTKSMLESATLPILMAR
jgi:nucleotide-binding universal stress UspA family protein